MWCFLFVVTVSFLSNVQGVDTLTGTPANYAVQLNQSFLSELKNRKLLKLKSNFPSLYCRSNILLDFWQPIMYRYCIFLWLYIILSTHTTFSKFYFPSSIMDLTSKLLWLVHSVDTRLPQPTAPQAQPSPWCSEQTPLCPCLASRWCGTRMVRGKCLLLLWARPDQEDM